MAYRNKEDCLREAERLGIDTTDLSWAELQKKVSAALKLEELEQKNTYAVAELDKMNKEKPTMAVNESKAARQLKAEANMLKPYLGKTIMLAPELSPERYRLVKYDEDLGSEIEVEDRRFDIDPNTGQVYDISGGKVDYDNIVDEYHDYTTGTYRIKNRSDRRVVAMSSVPKENAGMFFRPGYDYATVVTWNGRAGYLWKHWRYPNVVALLKAAGDKYYQKYKGRFKDEPNVWYAAGKMLVCDPHLVHQTLKDIEEDVRKDRLEEEARLRRMGIDPDEFQGGQLW